MKSWSTTCKLRKNPALERAIAEAMTINETSFFRDGRPFDLLRTELLPKLLEARRLTRTLRFWSAACSTGQEAYSCAMLLREHFPSLASWNVRIEGTDISAEVVARARQARYHRIEINRGLPARILVRYFDHVGEDWIVKPEIRKLCTLSPGQSLRSCRCPFTATTASMSSSCAMSCSISPTTPGARCWPPFTASSHPTASSSSAPRTARRSIALERRAGRRHLPLSPPPAVLTPAHPLRRRAYAVTKPYDMPKVMRLSSRPATFPLQKWD